MAGPPSQGSDKLAWKSTAELIGPKPADGINWHSIKDPTVVFHDDRWHIFATVRGKPRTHATVYLSFADWSTAANATHYVLPMHKGYFCAPQVFWFAPHQRWYLICQASDPAWGPQPYRPAFSTNSKVDDWRAWSPLKPMFPSKPDNIPGWIDFWVICDSATAFLFFTSNNGQMWRSETKLSDFPLGWSKPTLALTGSFFEASHTYKLKGKDEYLTVIEAEHGPGGGRYYQSYLANNLRGPWRTSHADKLNPFASQDNVTWPKPAWCECISHGELIRSSNDQNLEIDPNRLQFVYQGVRHQNYHGVPYGDIPWRIGRLDPAAP